MKCGEIWARRKRSSACTARRRDRSSSASSSWVDTNCATSLHRRRRPAGAAGSRTAERADDAPIGGQRDHHPRRQFAEVQVPAVQVVDRQHLRSARAQGGPDRRGRRSARWAASMPSAARTPSTSAMTTPRVPRRFRRCEMDRSAELLVEAGPQCGGGEVGRVQRHVRRPLHRRPEPTLTAEGEPRHRGDQDTMAIRANHRASFMPPPERTDVADVRSALRTSLLPAVCHRRCAFGSVAPRGRP